MPFGGTAKIDRGLLTAVILLGFFGILMVFDSSSVMAAQNFNDKFHFVKLHGVWAFLGMIIMLLLFVTGIFSVILNPIRYSLYYLIYGIFF